MSSHSDSPDRRDERPGADEFLEMPAPTAFPLTLALGFALLASGVVTNVALSVLGAMVVVVGAWGWIRDLLPGNGMILEELASLEQRPRPVEPAPGSIEKLKAGEFGHRMRVPEMVHPYSAGIKGGLVGGIAMSLIALAYGFVSGRGPWYPINLLAGMVAPGFDVETIEQLQQFSSVGLGFGLFVHVVTSLGIGLLYGLLLPMLPSRPVLWGGLVAPFLWSGAIHSMMGVLNPKLRDLVDWPWFVASQFAYGIAVGVVVMLSEKVYASDLWGGGPPDFPPEQLAEADERKRNEDRS